MLLVETNNRKIRETASMTRIFVETSKLFASRLHTVSRKCFDAFHEVREFVELVQVLQSKTDTI
jgi:hypothetical protein